MPSAQRGDLEVAGAGEGLAGMGQAGAVPTPALSLGRAPGGGDSAVGRSQTPREGGETGGAGKGSCRQHPGKRHDQQRRRRSCAGPKNRMSRRGSAPRGSAGLWGGGGAWEDVGLLLFPKFGLARSCLER